jgi:hypothetical protein
MNPRDKLDAQIWATHLANPPVPGPPPHCFPVDYEQLATYIGMGPDALFASSWVHGWSQFLHYCFEYKQSSFFAKRPPETFTVEEQAYLAASAEILCDRFNLPIPDWVHEPRYHLPKYWAAFKCVIDPDDIDERLAEADPVYLKHGVIARARDLLVV